MLLVLQSSAAYEVERLKPVWSCQICICRFILESGRICEGINDDVASCYTVLELQCFVFSFLKGDINFKHSTNPSSPPSLLSWLCRINAAAQGATAA